MWDGEQLAKETQFYCDRTSFLKLPFKEIWKRNKAQDGYFDELQESATEFSRSLNTVERLKVDGGLGMKDSLKCANASQDLC